MTDQSMIERVKAAIRESLEETLRADGYTLPANWVEYHMDHAARAAIAAMREPTESVAIQVGDAINCAPQTACEAARFVVGVFVDAALEGGK